MNSITLQVHPITKQESLFARKFNLRVFAELDSQGREIAFFGEVHESTLKLVPNKPVITRTRTRPVIRATQLLKSVSKKKRGRLNSKTNMGEIARYCHEQLRGGPKTRAELISGVQKEFGFKPESVGPAISSLTNPETYNHLMVADS